MQIKAWIDTDDYERLRELAKEEGRSITRQLHWVLSAYISQPVHVQAAEKGRAEQAALYNARKAERLASAEKKYAAVMERKARGEPISETEEIIASMGGL